MCYSFFSQLVSSMIKQQNIGLGDKKHQYFLVLFGLIAKKFCTELVNEVLANSNKILDT